MEWVLYWVQDPLYARVKSLPLISTFSLTNLTISAERILPISHPVPFQLLVPLLSCSDGWDDVIARFNLTSSANVQQQALLKLISTSWPAGCAVSTVYTMGFNRFLLTRKKIVFGWWSHRYFRESILLSLKRLSMNCPIRRSTCLLTISPALKPQNHLFTMYCSQLQFSSTVILLTVRYDWGRSHTQLQHSSSQESRRPPHQWIA